MNKNRKAERVATREEVENATIADSLKVVSPFSGSKGDSVTRNDVNFVVTDELDGDLDEVHHSGITSTLTEPLRPLLDETGFVVAPQVDDADDTAADEASCPITSEYTGALRGYGKGLDVYEAARERMVLYKSS